MNKLLYIQSSPRQARSASIEVANAFVDRVKELHVGCVVTTLDLWTMNLPEFSPSMLEAKYAGLAGVERTPDQVQAWQQIEALAAMFFAADHLVFAVPLWNFGIPYKLKQLIDLVSQKDVLFRFSTETGASGMLTGRSATLVCARGADYPVGLNNSAHAMDYQRPYMEMWLRLIGVDDVQAIVVDKTLYGPELDTASRAQGRREAVALAQRPFATV